VYNRVNSVEKFVFGKFGNNERDAVRNFQKKAVVFDSATKCDDLEKPNALFLPRIYCPIFLFLFSLFQSLITAQAVSMFPIGALT
jgi:hypothetical protein